jgi:lysophospholipase L1-like esterase
LIAAAMAACSILFAGDSLAVGAAQAAHAPAGCVIARVGAGSSDGLRQIEGRHVRGARVAVSLGVNDDPSSAGAFEQRVNRIVRAVGPQGRVAWATIADRRHEPFNRALMRAERRYRGVLVLVPWQHEVRLGRVRLGDGVHPGSSGYRVLWRLFDRALR